MLVTFAAFRSSSRKRSAVRYRAGKEVAVDVAKGVPFATAVFGWGSGQSAVDQMLPFTARKPEPNTRRWDCFGSAQR